MAKSTHVIDTSFDAEVLKCDIPVLTDFWAEWSAPCKRVAAYVEEIAEEYAGKVKVAKLDIDDNPMVTSQYSVLSIPTLILFKFGQPVERLTGDIPKATILEKIRPYFDE